jgi:hypothetical protein
MTKVPVQAEELHLRRLEGPTGPTDRHRIHRTVSTDGTEIVGSVHGQGPPLVLVHGTAGDHTRWEPVRPVLLAEMERLMAAGESEQVLVLFANAPALLDVAESREFASDLPVEPVIRVGHGGYEEPTGLLRNVLGRRDGWILVRPDAHIAWARHRRDGMEEAVRHGLGLRDDLANEAYHDNQECDQFAAILRGCVHRGRPGCDRRPRYG